MRITPNVNAMGYDRAITVFNPEGRLLQVEYAQKAVSSGAISMGITCKDAVILIAHRPKVDRLQIIEDMQKIFNIDKHISSAASGIISDARVLIKNARDFAQQHKLTYGERTDIRSIVSHLANVKQTYTQYGGIRPFGISLLIGSVDNNGPALYLTDPTGTYFKYFAKAIGSGSEKANILLIKEYKTNLSVDNGLKLAQKILKLILKNEYSPAQLECSVIRKSGVSRVTIKN